jgi:uncharacterized membrane protein
VKHWRPARIFFALALLALVGGATACAGGDAGVDAGADTGADAGGDAGADGGPGNCPTFSQVTIWQRCLPCHSSTKTTPADRMDALIGVDFDQYESAKANAATANEWVKFGLMPPSPMPAPTDAEKASLQAWVDCGTPK